MADEQARPAKRYSVSLQNAARAVFGDPAAAPVALTQLGPQSGTADDKQYAFHHGATHHV